jgi:hypothetical protein
MTLMRSRSFKWQPFAGILVFLGCAFAMAYVRRPSVDEAWFSGPAWSLAFKGFMGTPYLEWHGTGLIGVDRHTYWIMPLHPVALALWYQTWGFGLLVSRIHSICWGLLALVALYSIVRDLTGRSHVGALALALTAVDYAFLRGASDARMDMMSLSLGMLGLAVFLHYARTHFAEALLLAECLIATAIFVHPNGVLAFVLLHGYLLARHRRALNLRRILLALTPYAVGAIGWGFYIAQDPPDFFAQMAYNAHGRAALLSHPWQIPVVGFQRLLLIPFGFGAAWSGWIVRLKALILVVYLGSCFAVIAHPALRRRRGALWLLAAAGFVLLGLSSQYAWNSNDYVIHLIPWLAALTALAFDYFLRLPHPGIRRAARAALAAFVLLQLGGVAARVRANDYRNEYLEAVRYLKDNTRPGESIMGSAELGFQLGFNRVVIDDDHLGYNTGRRASYIVIEHRYRVSIDYMRQDPAHAAYLKRLLESEYEKVYDRHFFEIYRRRPSPLKRPALKSA